MRALHLGGEAISMSLNRKMAIELQALDAAMEHRQSIYPDNRCLNRYRTFIQSIEVFNTKNGLTKELVELIKMKKSDYRDILIEKEIWTEETYERIQKAVMHSTMIQLQEPTKGAVS